MFVGINLGINQLRSSTASFSPASLFAANEPGVWFDPSDLTTLYQDPAGTTPVTTPGQTVGLMLDKSKGLVLGTELVVNGTFDTNLTGWGVSNVVWSAGTASFTGIPSLTQSMATSSGTTYRVTITVSGLTGGSMWLRFTGGTAANSPTFSNGVNTFVLRSNGNTSLLIEQATGTITAGAIDNISVRELAGNHATQATPTARPNYGIEPVGGRRNLLLNTESLGGGAGAAPFGDWINFNTTNTSNAIVAPNGTTTANRMLETTTNGFHTIYADGGNTCVASAYTASFAVKGGLGRDWCWVNLYNGDNGTADAAKVYFNVTDGSIGTVGSGATASRTDLGNGWWRFSVTRTVAAGTQATASALYATVGSASADGVSSYAGDITKGIYIWGAQLELGSTATAYQRVTTQYDVTEAGVASTSYLAFDGVDDGMVTGTITPGVDKVQVFAGVRKISDALLWAVVGLGSNINSDLGSFEMANYDAGGSVTNFYCFRARGTLGGSVVAASGYTAPITNVLTGTADISGDAARLRINGSQVAQSTSDLGTGNFLAYPLYIGLRGGTTLPFKGNVYSLITRFGANLDAGIITSTEGWVAGKTGFYQPIITGVPTIGVS